MQAHRTDTHRSPLVGTPQRDDVEHHPRLDALWLKAENLHHTRSHLSRSVPSVKGGKSAPHPATIAPTTPPVKGKKFAPLLCDQPPPQQLPQLKAKNLHHYSATNHSTTITHQQLPRLKAGNLQTPLCSHLSRNHYPLLKAENLRWIEADISLEAPS